MTDEVKKIGAGNEEMRKARKAVADIQAQINVARAAIGVGNDVAAQRAARDVAKVALKAARQTFITAEKAFNVAVDAQMISKNAELLTSLEGAKTALDSKRKALKPIKPVK